MQLTTLLAPALLSTLVSAHFKLNYPTSLGFDDDNEPNAPCGGEDIKFTNSDTEVPVDGFPVALLSTHPTAKFSYRATLDKQAPFNWVELRGIDVTGLGNFCVPNLKAPANWTGQAGLVQVIGDLGDGILYQCAAVKFVSGSTTNLDTNVCKNGTVTATVSSNGNATTSSSNTTSPDATESGSGSGSGTGSSPSPSASTGAAAGLVGSALFAGLGAAFVGLAAAL